jgi:glycoside/pentoside/hexuronide:cation symporter, GPH family
MPSPPRDADPGAAEPADPPARIPALRKVGYGVGNVAYSLPYQASASFFLYFATEILKIPPALAGGAGLLSAVWDAITDPLVGYLSDNTEGRLGRRHPYLLGGGLSIAVLTFFFWTIPPGASLVVRIALLFGLLLLLKTALAAYYIPYLALGGELSRDYDQRSSIQGVRAVFYLAGMITALVGGPVIFFRSTPSYPKGQLNPAAYPRMAAAFAVLAAATALISFFATRRYIAILPQRTAEMRARKASAAHVMRDFFEALKNRELLMLVLMIFVLEAGFQFGINIGFHVNTYTYGLSGPMIGLLGLIVLGTSVISQPFWVWFTKRFEKKTALVAGILIGFVGFIGAPWTHVWWKLFPIQAPTLPLTLGLFMVAAGLGNGAFMSIPNSMIADAADVEELRTGKRDEGLYFGTYTLAYKAGTAVSWALAGIALSWIGFTQGSTVQSEDVRFRLAMTPSYLLLATAPFALFFILRYGITRERWRQIHEALELKRAAKSSGEIG